MAQEEDKILHIKLDYQEAIKGIAEYRKQIADLQAEEKGLKKALEESNGENEEVAKQYEATKIAIKQYSDELRSLQKEVQNGMRQDKEAEGSLKSLRAELSNLTKQYDALSRTEREGAKGKELQKHINEVTSELKEAEEATQRYYRNVGNYENAINNAIGVNSKWFALLQQMAELFSGGLTQGVNTATSAVSAFGKQLLALLANPIVLMLGAIAVALKAVADGISNNEENSNRWNLILAPLKRTLELVSNAVQEFAGVILSAVEAGGKLLGWVDSMIEKLPIIGDYMEKYNQQVADGIELERERQELIKEHRQEEIADAKVSLESQRLLTKAYDKATYSAKERLEFLRQASKIEQDQADKSTELARRELELAQKRASVSKNDQKTNDELAQKEADYYRKQQQREALQTSLKQREGKLLSQIKSEQSAVNKETEKNIQLNEKRYQLLINVQKKYESLMVSMIKDEIEQKRKAYEISYKQEIESLQHTLTKKKELTAETEEYINKTIEAKQKERLLMMEEFDRLAKDKTIENATKLYQLQLESVAKQSLAEFNLRLQLLRAQREKELNEKNLTEQMKLAIVAKYDKLEQELNNQQAEQEVENMKLAFENKILEMQLENSTELQLLQERADEELFILNSMQQKEGESIEEFNNKKLQAQLNYNNTKKQMLKAEQEMEMAKFEASSKITGALSGLLEQLGDENKTFLKMSKVLALAQVAIDTGKAISSGISSAMSVPFPANLGAIATTIATILGNMATAISTIKSAKFATGGYVSGAGTATSDSIPARLSNGESVMNANTTSMFSPLLSALNQLGGGVPIVASNPSQMMGEDMLANAVAKGMQYAPSPVVSVVDITKASNKVRVIGNIARL